ncbi:MAG: hypothetical protein B6D54_03380 [Epsilonproteobacteria bacterium 4484_65]|nr:MAG: hypothetical protein B6D54_03380 [Epsilonproteobacteria bacterium 4484_65]
MLKVQYVGPRVEISNHGVAYRKSKEDKYVYLMVALEILKNIDNDAERKKLYSHDLENKALEEVLHSILKCHESGVEEKVKEEGYQYEQKMLQEIETIQNLPHLTDIDKEVWIKNIELMKVYRIQRAVNKRCYIHCIQNIIQVIKNKQIQEITTPFNKSFFHVLNSIRGALIAGKPSLDAKVIEENNKDDHMIVKLSIG